MTRSKTSLLLSACAVAMALAPAALAQTSSPGTPHPATPIARPATTPPPPAPAGTRPAPPPATNGAPPVDRVFAEFDTDHNGSITQQEFRAGWARMRTAIVVERLREQFNAVDANRNGAIDTGEYGNLLLVKRAGASAPALSAFDANRDQKLDFKEYAALVQRLSGPQGPAPAPAGK